MHSRRHILWRMIISYSSRFVYSSTGIRQCFSTQPQCFNVVSGGKSHDFLFLQIAEDGLPRSGTRLETTVTSRATPQIDVVY